MQSRFTVLSLFDRTGNMVRPWAEAGYKCLCLDIQHRGVRPAHENVLSMHWDASAQDFSPPDNVGIVFAFPPCDHLAVSGARWFKDKGLESLHEALGLVIAAKRLCEQSGAPWMIENPVSTLSTYWRKPDYSFHPYEYGGYGHPEDSYTKKTCLWAGGGFVIPPKKPVPLGDTADRIHKAAPGPERKNFRSETPMGFARAVFEANAK